MFNDPTLNRRAVFTGLQAFFNANGLEQAMKLWEQYCSLAQGAPSVQRFLAELCQTDDLKARRSDMLRSILQAMRLPARDLLPDPAPATTGKPISEQQETRHKMDKQQQATTVFSAMIPALFAVCPRDIQHYLAKDFATSLVYGNLPGTLFQSLHTWLTQQGELLIPVTEPSLLRALLNQAYIILCEHTGPVQADALLAKAIEQLQMKHPELAGDLPMIL